jgi:hypothetical protein
MIRVDIAWFPPAEMADAKATVNAEGASRDLLARRLA